MYRIVFEVVKGWSAVDHLAGDLIREAERGVSSRAFASRADAGRVGKAALRKARSALIARGGLARRAAEPRVDVVVVGPRAV